MANAIQVEAPGDRAATAPPGLEPERTGKDVSIPIGGMTCTACARAIERAVQRLDGVSSVAVTFATEKAAVHYDPAATRLSEIKQAIVKAGYVPLASET